MKKIMRKGFTLVELLVVLTVIGILSSVATISGRDVSAIANANKIVENFKIISIAMDMYYKDNQDACDNFTADATGATKIKDALLGSYLRTNAPVTAVDAASATAGKFNIVIHTDNSWWLVYTLTASNHQIAKILANKALQEGFVSAVGKKVGVDGDKYAVTEEDGALTSLKVWYQVR